MAGRRNLGLYVMAASGLVLLTSRCVFADNGCSALSTASAGELLTIPEHGTIGLPLPTTVRCTRHELKAAPEVCRSRSIVIQDRMLDSDHRLIITRPKKPQISSGPDKRPFDSTLIYACVEGQVKVVYTGALHAGGRIEAIGADKFIESDSYENSSQRGLYQNTYYWHPKSETCTDDPMAASFPSQRERIPCDDLEKVKAAQIIALATDGLLQYSHGFGLYDDGEYEVTLADDRMVGAHRRLLAVRRNHLKGAGVVDDHLVFACLSGVVKPVVQEDTVAVREASEDKLVVVSVTPDPKHRFRYFQTVYTFAWNGGLGDYMLTSVDSRPLRP